MDWLFIPVLWIAYTVAKLEEKNEKNPTTKSVQKNFANIRNVNVYQNLLVIRVAKSSCLIILIAILGVVFVIVVCVQDICWGSVINRRIFTTISFK